MYRRHLSSLKYFFSPLMTVGLPLSMYNAALISCRIWIPPYSKDCMTPNGPKPGCTRNPLGLIYRWAFYNGPLWLMIICVTVLMGMLTLSVKREEKEVIAKRNEGTGSSDDNAGEGEDVFDDNNLNVDIDVSQISCEDINASIKDDINHGHKTPSAFRREENFNLERTKRLFKQAVFYVITFYITWFPSTIGALLAFFTYTGRGRPPFSILVLICTFEPMQGFWNSLGK